MTSNNELKNNRYIYAWYYTDTNEIFYIGKGTNGRWKDVVGSRNEYFKSIIAKHLDKGEVSVKKLYENLTEKESLELERKLIREYWDKGLCKANFHEGGCGGYTGNYKNPERSRKISEAMKRSWKDPNSKLYGPNKGRKFNEEWCHKISVANKGKRLTEEQKKHYKAAQAEFRRHKDKVEQRARKLSEHLKGIKRNSAWLYNNRLAQSKHHYFVKWDNKVIYDTYFTRDLIDFLRNTDYIHISREITHKLLEGNYKPSFNKHIELMKHLEVLMFDKSVSTIPDECKEVESEISTDSKCMTSEYSDEEIVSYC